VFTTCQVARRLQLLMKGLSSKSLFRTTFGAGAVVMEGVAPAQQIG
jgi:hypothetical protein